MNPGVTLCGLRELLRASDSGRGRGTVDSRPIHFRPRVKKKALARGRRSRSRERKRRESSVGIKRGLEAIHSFIHPPIHHHYRVQVGTDKFSSSSSCLCLGKVSVSLLSRGCVVVALSVCARAALAGCRNSVPSWPWQYFVDQTVSSVQLETPGLRARPVVATKELNVVGARIPVKELGRGGTGRN